MMHEKTTMGVFVKVEASELRLDDEFMKYQPKTKEQREFKELVETAIKSGLKDFWRPICDPSFDDNGRICYEPGNMPAVYKSYNWWEETTKNFCPERGSRLGTKTEYIAFLAVLIKELIASGKSVEWTWNAVCNDSKELGHYVNSDNAKYAYEDTGSRAVCGFYDLANVFKILAEDKESCGFWIAGGVCLDGSDYYPLASHYHYLPNDDVFIYAVGWLVLENVD